MFTRKQDCQGPTNIFWPKTKFWSRVVFSVKMNCSYICRDAHFHIIKYMPKIQLTHKMSSISTSMFCLYFLYSYRLFCNNFEQKSDLCQAKTRFWSHMDIVIKLLSQCWSKTTFQPYWSSCPLTRKSCTTLPKARIKTKNRFKRTKMILCINYIKCVK